MYKNFRKIISKFRPAQQQLEMFKVGIKKPYQIELDPQYELKVYSDEFFVQYVSLLENSKLINNEVKKIIKDQYLSIPRSHFLIIDLKTKDLVGSFMGSHNYDRKHRSSSRMDWLAVDKRHQGKGLGRVLSQALVNRFHEIGYKTIFVGTNDNMLAALSVYLKLGFIPNLFSDQISLRWEKVCKKLNFTFEKNLWKKYKVENNILTYLT